MKKILAIILLVFSLPSPSVASKIYLETEVLIDVFGGASLHIKKSSTFFNNLTVGVGAMKMKIPEDMFDEYPDAVGKGWKVNLTGGRLFFDYHFSDPDKGPTIGLHIALEQYVLQRRGSSSTMWQLGGALRLGYLWRPLDGGFYLMPVLTVLNSRRVSGDNEVQGETFDTDYFGFQPFFGLGYSF